LAALAGGAVLTDGNKELLAEVERLRRDLRQLREVVNVLVNVIMDEEELDDEDQEFPPGRGNESTRFNIYN